MDRPVTRFVAEMIEEIASEKREVERAEETLAMFQRLAKEEPKGEFAKYRGVALEDYWRKQRPFQPEALSYRKLPPLSKSTVPTWWTIAESKAHSCTMNCAKRLTAKITKFATN